MKIKSISAVTLLVIVFILYSHTNARGVEPLSSDTITRFELESYLVNQEVQRQEMLDKAIKSTVQVRLLKEGRWATGSGFFISPSTILTNRHNLYKVDKFEIVTQDGKTCGVTSTFLDMSDDLAVIKTDCKMPYLTANYNPRVGQDVYSLGNPEELEYSISKGIVSALRYKWGADWVQFDAHTNSGSSGGALINSKGEVIGIVSARSAEKNWVGLALPIFIAKGDINRALEREVTVDGNSDSDY